MNILIWIVFGAIVGWIASKIMDTDAEQGLIGNIVVGIIGAFIGGFVMQSLGGSGVTGFNLGSLFVALLGSVILLAVYKAIAR
ncbi:GlsB/YeaQ/YmgE family stress response membrane protein [Candidatus Saccharibacteria bacterium]|nr:GlsB/YeaQ/YmgE family stress response membrane protein [Candidatus Saccharibacteria bacterium]